MRSATPPLIALTILFAIVPSASAVRSPGVSHAVGSVITAQIRLIPNPAGADESTDGGNRVTWTTRTGTAVLYDLRTKHITVVATSQAASGNVVAMVRGEWLAYIDDPDARWTGMRWILKLKDLKTGKIQILDRADPTIAPQVAERLRPTIALSKQFLVWNDWRRMEPSIEARVHAIDLGIHVSRVLTRSTSNDLLDVATSGHNAAWSRMSLAPGAQANTASSTLWLDNLSTGRVMRIDRGKGASEANMWGRHLVYKASITRYDEGNVYLYDLASGRTSQLTHFTPPNWADAPSVGASIVVWNEVASVGAYDLRTQRPIPLHPSDGGRAYTAGHILVYVASTNPKAPEHSPYALVIDRFR
jgi:hypothetical protein